MDFNDLGKFRKFLTVGKAVFTPIAILCLIYYFWGSKNQITLVVANADPKYLLLSLGCWLFCQLISPLFPWTIFRTWPTSIPYRALLRIHVNRLPTKYLPGSIWNTVSRSIDYAAHSTPPKTLFYYFSLELAAPALVTISAGSLIIFLLIDTAESVRLGAALTAVGCLLLLAFLPLGYNYFNRDPDYAIPLTAFVQGIVSVGIFWLFAAFSFVLFLNAFPQLLLVHSWTEIAGVYIFSWGIGFVSLIAPQGLGVFEFVAASLLDGGSGFPQLVIIIAGFRLVTACGDFVAWGIIKMPYVKN